MRWSPKSSDAFQARVEDLEEVRRALTCRKREKQWDKRPKPTAFGFWDFSPPSGPECTRPGGDQESAREARTAQASRRAPGGSREAKVTKFSLKV